MEDIFFSHKFFSHYDQLAKFADSLSGVATQLATATNSLQQAQSRLAEGQAFLAHNVKETKILIDRIKCVSSHWFYGNTALQPQLWLRGGTEGKISRAEAKLAKFEEERPGLEAGIAQLQSPAGIAQLQDEVNRLQALSNDKAGADKERAAMRERAVKAHPSPRLQYLNSTAEEWKVNLAFEKANSSVLKEVGKLCHEAHDGYEKIISRLQKLQDEQQAAIREHGREQRKAGQDAQMAVPHHEHILDLTGHKMITFSCSVCRTSISKGGRWYRCSKCDFDACLGCVSKYSALREAMDQRDRDRVMEEAARILESLNNKLTKAFAMVPAAMRQHYPAQCAQIGHVQLPLLSQTDFGSRWKCVNPNGVAYRVTPSMEIDTSVFGGPLYGKLLHGSIITAIDRVVHKDGTIIRNYLQVVHKDGTMYLPIMKGDGTVLMEFFGGRGELMRWYTIALNKIQSNIAIVNQCKSVAHSQVQTVRALEAQLLRDADEARRQLQLTTQHLEAEKDQIMAALRNAMMHGGGSPQAAPAVPMAMMPAASPMATAAAYTPQMASPAMAGAYPPQMAAPPMAMAGAYPPQMASPPMAMAAAYPPQMAASPMATAAVYTPQHNVVDHFESQQRKTAGVTTGAEPPWPKTPSLSAALPPAALPTPPLDNPSGPSASAAEEMAAPPMATAEVYTTLTTAIATTPVCGAPGRPIYMDMDD